LRQCAIFGCEVERLLIRGVRSRENVVAGYQLEEARGPTFKDSMKRRKGVFAWLQTLFEARVMNDQHLSHPIHAAGNNFLGSELTE
jgi:hypothetical protein